MRFGMLDWAPYWVVDGVVFEDWSRSPASVLEFIVERRPGEPLKLWERWGGNPSFKRVPGEFRTLFAARAAAEELALTRGRAGASRPPDS